MRRNQVIHQPMSDWEGALVQYSASVNRRKGERGGGVARGTGVVGQATAAHRGRCALRRVGNVSALKLGRRSSGGRGVGDAAPYGGCDRVCFSGAVKWTGSLGAVSRGRYDVCCNFGYAVARRVHRPRCTVAAGLPSWVRRTRPARPTAPASSTVHPLCVHNPTYEIPRAQPAHHLGRANRRRP